LLLYFAPFFLYPGPAVSVNDHSNDSSHDQSFFNVFMVVIGILIGITFFLILLARAIAGEPQLAWARENQDYRAAIDERLTPAGKALLPDELPAGGVAVAAVAETAAPVAAKLTGEQVYNNACFACHGAGVGGAPKFGDAGAWGARIGQGKATLNKHAVEGYQGKAGYMPPKGGRVDLSDEEIIAAVDFMVSKSS
jgi:cytochrome c5